MATNVYYAPSGTQNLATIFPAIVWDDVVSYTVEVTDGASTLGTSPRFDLFCHTEHNFRLHFENSAGAVDAVDFIITNVIHEDTADEFQNSLNYPLSKLDTGIERYNIKSNDIWEGKHKCYEQDMDLMRELADSPKIWMEWLGTEGQPDDYLPMVKVAGRFEKKGDLYKWDNSFIVQVKLSNDYITQRN